MLHECRRRTDRHPGDLAPGTDRISVHGAGDPLQPAADHRGFLGPLPARRCQLRLHGPDARILPLIGRAAWRRTCCQDRLRQVYRVKTGTAAENTSSWWSVPSGLFRVLLELSDQPGWAIPPKNERPL